MTILLSALSLVACTGPSTPTPDTDTDETETDTDVDTDDTDIPDPEGDPATVELAGTCDLAERWGGFRIDNGDAFGYIDGTVRLGVIPSTVPAPVDADAGCRLDQRLNPFCDPPCPGDQTCNLDNECVPFPVAQDLGTVTVAGVLPGSVAIEPFELGNSYQNTDVENPPVAPDSLVEVRIPDSPWGSLDLHGVGVEPLTASDDLLLVEEDVDLAIEWTPASGLGRSVVFFRLNIDQHGNSPVNLTCEWPDTGSASVPSGLIEQLINAGVTGFPSATVTRRTADNVAVGDQGEGCIDLEVTSPRTLDVRVDGFTPCNGPGQCPEGQECNLPLEICE